VGALGPLALELALRPPGETVAFRDAAAKAGLDEGARDRVVAGVGVP
jgi:hypothetical protein